MLQIKEELAKEIVEYLKQRPWVEANNLIVQISKLEPVNGGSAEVSKA